VNTGRTVRRRAAVSLGIAGSALGMVAGAVQALVGHRIPEWTGAKQAPVSLGLLTIALSLLAGYAAYRQARPRTTVAARAAYTAALLLPGLLCLSTVGRLWFLPGPLLIAAALLSVDSVRDTWTLVSRNWLRCLLALLGAAELLMAANAAPVTLAVGAVGGVALITGATVRRSRTFLIAMLIFGTVPFTVVAWTAIVPVLLLLAAAVIAAPLVHRVSPVPALRP
jgi:hypothetical protein